MNMYKFAHTMEQDAEQLYRNLASRASTTGVKNIFNMMAEDEKREGKAVAILEKKFRSQSDDRKNQLPEMKTVYRDMLDNIDDIPVSEDELKDYKLILDIEKKGLEFYRENLGQLGTGEALHLLRCLSNQELYHIQTLENLIEMLEKDLWRVDDAEFNLTEEDYN
ncbi:MAG: hypothetical protein JXR86_12465 [Spirochaetales bacterium]|nr:hypothetical protein [Spirochaetales bacterium]